MKKTMIPEKGYLITAIMSFVSAGIVLTILLQGCATSVQPVCRHDAIYQAMTFSDLTGCPVRIAIGYSTRLNKVHAQAQAFLDGKWTWLRQTAPVSIEAGSQESFEPKTYVTVKGLVNRLKIADPKRQDLGVMGVFNNKAVTNDR